MPHDRVAVLTGIACMVLATACFAVLDTTVKYIASTVSLLMAVTVRYLVQALLSAAVLVPLHGASLLRIRYPRLQLLRALVFVATTVLAMLALLRMPVGEFAAMMMVTPILVTVLSVTVMKEKVSVLHWLCLVGGMAGTLVILRPGSHLGLGWWALIPLACIACGTAFQLLSSHLGQHENAATTHLCTVWIAAVLGLLVLPWTWSPVASAGLWGLMVFMGVIGAAGHFILMKAYGRAPASTLMPYMYCQIGFAVLCGWWVFAHAPDAWAWGGIAVITLCGIGSAWLTARQHRPPARLPET